PPPRRKTAMAKVTTAAPGDTSLTTFYKDMTASERRTFWACFGGWTLDGMDFLIYPLVITTIISLWQVDRGTAGLAVTATLLFSAIGGWLAGYVSDRIGRVKTLQIAILWFSAFSLLCAFAQNFSQLMVFRALLGVGAQGGYYAIATWVPTFLKTERGLTTVGSTEYLAYLIVGAFVGYLVGAWLSDRIGRRNLFLLFSICTTAVVIGYTQFNVS